MLALRDWLERRRAELTERLGEALPRPVFAENPGGRGGSRDRPDQGGAAGRRLRRNAWRNCVGRFRGDARGAGRSQAHYNELQLPYQRERVCVQIAAGTKRDLTIRSLRFGAFGARAFFCVTSNQRLWTGHMTRRLPDRGPYRARRNQR
jgi:hypothetical protein